MEHRTEKWNPVFGESRCSNFGEIRCSNKELDRHFASGRMHGDPAYCAADKHWISGNKKAGSGDPAELIGSAR
jgi:hypothetical protein